MGALLLIARPFFLFFCQASCSSVPRLKNIRLWMCRCGSTHPLTARLECGDRSTAAREHDVPTIQERFKHTFGQPVLRFGLGSNGPKPSGTAVQINALRVGVVFCGRQTPGGHNVIWGLRQALKSLNAGSTLVGFEGGTKGMFKQRAIEITSERLKLYKNQGGFDLLGRSVDQVRTPEQIDATAAACAALNLNGLVMVGGTFTGGDAAILAEQLVGKTHTCVSMHSCCDGSLFVDDGGCVYVAG